MYIDVNGLKALAQSEYMAMIGVTSRRSAGRYFEADMLRSLKGFKRNTKAFKSPARSKRSKHMEVVPDGIACKGWSNFFLRHPLRVLLSSEKNDFHIDVKLTGSKSLSPSYSSNQLRGMISNLAKKSTKASKTGRNAFMLVTGSDTKIGWSLILHAMKSNVALYH